MALLFLEYIIVVVVIITFLFL